MRGVMGLSEKISQEIKAAMKSGDRLRLETLRTLRAALMEKTIEKRGAGQEISPDDEVAVLLSAAKKRRESIEEFTKGGRMELVEQETKELGIIQEYLPAQMSPEEISRAIDEIASGLGVSSPSDFGKVMSQAMKQLRGRADGKLVQELVKKRLGVG
jgi:uncharacterized protein YqeY